jgi:hypothetical protein
MYQKAHHATQTYYESILRRWKEKHRNVKDYFILREDRISDLKNIKDETIVLQGYFQNYSYFWDCLEEFKNTLVFNKFIVKQYPKLDESCFIHVRGGDYKNIPLHLIPLDTYYKRAIKEINAPHYYIFTNDSKYLKTHSFMNDISYTIVDDINEVDSLYLMSKCEKGGICANSTFSWWGAALNIERPICMPSKWYNDPSMKTSGYYFPGVKIISVEEYQK